MAVHTASTVHRVDGVFHRLARWFDFNWMIGSGEGLRQSSLRSAALGGRQRTIATSSRRSCGGVGRACHGGICPTSSVRGRRSSIVSTDGRRLGSGGGCWMHCRPTATTNGTASTAQSTALTSTRREEKGGLRSGYRSVARRALHEGPPGGRCVRPPADVRDHRGAAPRQPAGSRAGRPRGVHLLARG